MKKIDITDKQFNELSEFELNRFIFSYNDGQGDCYVNTFDEIVELFEDVDISNLNRTQILDRFYNESCLNGNNSNISYYDGEKYLNVFFI